MPISEFCHNDVVVLDKNSTVIEAARKMRELHVGDVVVVEKSNGGPRRPVGILTDRDIVVGVIALGIELKSISVEDVMTPTLVTVPESAGVNETIHLMEAYGVRRMPVVAADGGLVGIVSSGDLLELLGREIVALSRLPSRQRLKEEEIRV